MTGTLTLAYDEDLARVTISGSGFTDAATVHIERSTDQVRWTTVRGAVELAVTAGAFSIPDYEFTPNALTHYRATPDVELLVSDSFTRSTSNGWGSATSGQAYTVQGTASDYATTGSLGTITASGTNADRSARADAGESAALRGRVKFRISALPGSGSLELGLILRGTDVNNWYIAKALIATATGALTLRNHKRVGGVATTIQDLVGGTIAAATDYYLQFELSGPSSGINTLKIKHWAAAGSEPADYELVSTDTSGQPPVGGTLTGLYARTAATGPVVSFDDLSVWDTAPDPVVSSITPTLDVVWLKSVTRPFANLVVELAGDQFTPGRPSRSGVFQVAGRSLPVGVTDVRGSRSYQVSLRTDDDGDAEDLDLLIASGDILYLQAPAGFVVPAGGVYVVAGDDTAPFLSPPDPLRWLVVTLTEVAAPAPDVHATQSNWQTVINAYETWADLIAGQATWSDVLALVGSPSDVIVD